MSVDSGSVLGNGGSGDAVSISADGRFVAFQSFASNLVPLDTNGTQDVFVHDRVNGTTERVSVDSTGLQGNGPSDGASMTPDGRFVAFRSIAGNLVPQDTNASVDVFVHDRVNGTTERVSVDSAGMQGNSHSGGASISGDGSCVCFYSSASNLVAGDTNGTEDVFVRDRTSGTTERVSVDSSGVQGNGSSYYGSSISFDGRFVAMASVASNLVAADTNGSADVFVRDRVNGTTERVSVDSLGAQGNSLSDGSSISADGRYVAFRSHASNLVQSDENDDWDAFVHDRQLGVTVRASVYATGAERNGIGFYPYPQLTSNGRYAVFASSAQLVPFDTNGVYDTFVRRLY